MSFDVVSRGFSTYSAGLSLILTIIGMCIGVSQSKDVNSGLFAMSVIFLLQAGELLYWFLRQVITSESQMISYVRASQITNLLPEK